MDNKEEVTLYDRRVTQEQVIPGAIKPRHLYADETEDMMFYSDGTNFQVIPQGTNGQFLTLDDTVPSWKTYTPTPPTPGPQTTTALARAYLNSAQNNIPASTPTKILLDAETFDPGADFGSNKYTVPTAGYYTITGQVGYGSVIADKSYYSMIYKNGVVNSLNVQDAATTASITVLVSDILLLAVNDTIELYGQADAGAATVDILAASEFTFLSIGLVSLL